MNDPLREIVLPALSARGPVRPSGGSWSARCPAHDDHEPSLSVSAGRTHPVLITCQAGCDRDDILKAIGLTWADICAPRERAASADDWIACGRKNDGGYDNRHRKVAEYLYRDASGAVVFGVARCALKGNGCQGFRQWRPDPTAKSGRRWSVTVDGQRVGEGLPYRLPDVLRSQQDEFPRNLFVTEGEKDADRLWNLGIPATCNAGGAGKWTPAHAQWLTAADVMIVADRDDAGWAHAEHVANTLMDIARSIEVVHAAAGKDISDHLDAGLHVGRVVTVAEPKAPPTTKAGTSDCGSPACPECRGVS